MHDEEDVVEPYLLPDVDVCRHARRLGRSGRVPDSSHVRGCPVCLRRLRVTEAALQGWRPMSHRRATAAVSRMAAAFASDDRDQDYRAFYAHLAACPHCDAELAQLTFDVDLPVRPRRQRRLAVVR